MTSNGILLKKIDPIHYFDQFISEGVYPDGRETVQFRPLFIEQCVDKQAYGSSYVQQSGACVSCVVNISVAPISDEPPIFYNLRALDLFFEELVEEANAHLTKLINDNNLFDANFLNSLNVDKSQSSFELRFTLHLEIVVINVDGFLMDAIVTAVQSAIMCTRLPRVNYTGLSNLEDQSPNYNNIPLQFDMTKLKLFPLDENSKYLQLNNFLVYTSILLYSKNNQLELLCDPTAELCSLISDCCNIMMGKNEKIYLLNFSSSIEFNDKILNEMIQIAKRRHTAISNALEKIQKQLK